jgi:hypothetical protein
MNVTKLKLAAEEFCRKVQAGEARSVRSYQAFKEALDEADDRAACQGVEPEPFRLLNWYRMQGGDLVQFVKAHNIETSYATMEDQHGVNRYVRRDFGRVTGSAHDYSDPRNTPPLYAAQPEPIAAEPVHEAIARVQMQFAGIVRAAVSLIAEVDENHATKGVPGRYTVPWDAVAALKDALTTTPAPEVPADRAALLQEVGRLMVEMTTTVRGEGEWLVIPELWRMCMEERDAALAKLAAAPEAPAQPVAYEQIGMMSFSRREKGRGTFHEDTADGKELCQILNAGVTGGPYSAYPVFRRIDGPIYTARGLKSDSEQPKT